MEHKDLSFTTPAGEKVYGSSRPPEDIKEKLRQQQEMESQLARELSQGLELAKRKETRSKMGKVLEMPSQKKTITETEKEAGKKAA